jgi:hypothetical protein
MSLMLSSDPSSATTYHCLVDLKVGRYWYYYRLAYDDDVIHEVDDERVTAVNNDMKMNNVRVHASDRPNGEDEQREWDEQERSKIESALSLLPKIPESKKAEEKRDGEEEGEKEKARESIALTEEEKETLMRFEKRRAEKEMKKQKEKEERSERIQLSEIEQKIANRR